MSMNLLLNNAWKLYQSHPELKKFSKWPDDLILSNIKPCMIPASSLVRDFPIDGTRETQAFIDSIKENVHLGNWTRTYSEKEVGYDFLNRYGYYELFGPNGHFQTTQLRAFIGYWGKNLFYDWHCHEAEEVYLVLAGGAWFYVEGEKKWVGPNQTCSHSSMQRHSMQTKSDPILTFVIWRGKGLNDLPKMVN